MHIQLLENIYANKPIILYVFEEPAVQLNHSTNNS